MKKSFLKAPPERHTTIRKAIIECLEGESMTAKEISAEVGIMEKDVSGHLEHIQKSLLNSKERFIVTPARCRSCGFVFRDRKKLKRPSRCPECHDEHLEEPCFSIK